jgi:hypothetical protein
MQVKILLQGMPSSSLLSFSSYPIRIFRKVDVAKSGTLDLQEFVSAYQMIFTRPSSFVGNNPPDKRGKKVSEYVCGVRYGLEMDRAVYELYFGTVIDLVEGPYLLMDEKRVYKISNVNEISDMEYEVTPGWTATLGDINEMIVRDSMNNKMGRSKIYWWVDISMIKVASCRVDKYIAALGLPNDSKFRSAFGQFGTCLPKEEKSHVYAGNGTSNLGGVSSLSFFVQALWILGLPIVHHMPAWLDTAIESYCTPSLRTSIKNYYYSRFAFLLSTSFSGSARVEEFASTYENAQAMANVSLPPPPPFLILIHFYCRGLMMRDRMKTRRMTMPPPLVSPSVQLIKSMPIFYYLHHQVIVVAIANGPQSQLGSLQETN